MAVSNSRLYLMASTAVLAASVIGALEPREAVHAAEARVAFRIRAIATNTPADGVVLDRINGGPVTTLEGLPLETANATNWRALPDDDGGALDELEQAHALRNVSLMSTAVDPAYDRLIQHPRFQRVLSQMGLGANEYYEK